MDELPADIWLRIAADARPVVCRWWSGLTDAERADAVAAWDEERQAAFFTPETGDIEPLPVVIGGRFVPAEHPELVGSEWQADYFEYLLKYPELLLPPPEYHIGGVCTAHPEARAVLASGCIPAGFVCPLSSAECPMRPLLAKRPNQALHLTRPAVLLSGSS